MIPIDVGQIRVKQNWQDDYKSSGRHGYRRTQPPLRFASQLEAVRIINQPVEDGISQGGIRNALVPVFHRDLGDNHSRGMPITVVKDIQ